MKTIAILGSTGSIGKSTLEIVKANPRQLKVKSLTAAKNWQLLAQQARDFEPEFVAIADPQCESELSNALLGSGIRVGSGEEAVIEAVTLSNTDAVVAAIVGSAGLKPVMEAIARKLQICLANKETLVVGGSLVMEAVNEAKIDLLPVDSEHSAIFQCLQGSENTPARKIIITASGGPFRTFTRDQLQQVTVEQALKHPNWNMGGKITIDSATLMNKGLEVIEAHWLFGMPYEQIEVVVHPQSLIHSLVEFSDGSVVAQLGWPDMKLPIQYALSWPDRWWAPLPSFDLVKAGSMTFEPPRLDDFPCLKLAFSAGKAAGTAPCIMNAANEIAVEAFMNKKISFVEIPQLIEQTMRAFIVEPATSIKQLIEVDKKARSTAAHFISGGHYYHGY